MPLTPSQFIEGQGGQLQAEWFSLTAQEHDADTYTDAASKLTDLLESWIERAVTLGHATAASAYDETDAGTIYVYVRAFRYVSRAIGFAPSRGSADDVGSYTFAKWQILDIEEALADWEEALEAEVATEVIPLKAKSVIVERKPIAWYG